MPNPYLVYDERRTTSRMNHQGALSMPLLLTLLLLTLAGFGTWSVMRSWRNLMELQVRLDRCVGNAAIDLKRTMNRIVAGNRRIKVLRVAELAALPEGGAAPFRILLIAQAIALDAELLVWQTKRARWMLRQGCDSRSDLPLPLPDLGWETGIPDELGPTPLTRRQAGASPLKIELFHWPRSAAAKVEINKYTGELTLEYSKWRATWTRADSKIGSAVSEMAGKLRAISH